MKASMFAALVGILLVSHATAEVYVVHPDGSGDYPTIQAAVDASSEGDEIVLESGVYRGDGNRDVLIYMHALVVRSATGDPRDCIIDCQGTAQEWHTGFLCDVALGQLELRGITVIRGYYHSGGAIRIGWGDVYISDCLFVGNRAEHHGAAVFKGGPDTVTLSGCTLVGNSSPIATVAAIDWGYLALENSIVAFSGDGYATSCLYGQSQFACCDFFGNADGDWDSPCAIGFLGIDGNISEDPLFCGWEEGNYYLQSDSPCAPGGECGLIGALPVGCEPSPIMESTWGGVKALYRHPATE